MIIDGKNPVLKALQLQNNGRHREAAAILQREGNKERPVSEKEALWKAAADARRKASSD